MSEKGKDYARGYVAGRKRQDKDVAAEKRQRDEARVQFEKLKEYNSERKIFERQVFCAALKGILESGTWERGGKKATSIEDHVYIAKEFAIKSGKEMMP